MFFKRFTAVFCCIAILSAQIFAQIKPSNQTANETKLAPELQEKSIALLKTLARDAEQFGLPENRVGARVLTANLLWEHDEKQARAVFQAAISELNSMVGQLRLDGESDEDDGASAEENSMALEETRQLRSDLLTALAARDPQAALAALAVLTRTDAGGANIFTDDGALELNLVAQIAAKDPKKAFELAEKNLQTALGYNLFAALESVHSKDADLGARLARDILARIKSSDTHIASSSDYASNPTPNGNLMTNGAMMGDTMTTSGSMSNMNGSPMQSSSLVVNVWEIQQFVQSVKKLNSQAVKDKKNPALTDAELKNLIGILAQKYVKQQYLSAYEAAPVMNDITKYFPAQAQAIRAKLVQNQNTTAELDNQIRAQELQSETEGKTAAEIFEIAEKKPVAEREKFYQTAAERAIEEGDFARAKDFYARVKKRDSYDYLGTKIEEGMPLALAQTGDLSQARQLLVKIKTPEQRIEILSALAQATMKNGDKKAAAAILNEARAQHSGRMRQRKNLNSLLELAQGYAVVEPDEAFTLLEGNISFFNDLIAAGILLDDFNEYGSVKSDEVDLDVVRAESYRAAPGGVRLIKKLAAADFDRTVALAGRFARPEAGFFARFRIAEALLDPNAEKTEKEMQQSEEHDMD